MKKQKKTPAERRRQQAQRALDARVEYERIRDVWRLEHRLSFQK